MGNCLVTTLNTYVDADDMLKMGSYIVYFQSYSGVTMYTPYSALYEIIGDSGGGHFCTDKTYSDNLGVTAQTSSSSHYVYLINDGSLLTLRITDNYTVTRMNIGNTDVIKYRKNSITSLTVLRAEINYNFNSSDLSGIVFQDLYLQQIASDYVTRFNIEDFSMKCGTFMAMSTVIEGTLEKFLENCVNIGQIQTGTTLHLYLIGTSVTYNGEALTNNLNVTKTDDGWDIVTM